MVPDRPTPSTASSAERQIFELLEATPMPGAVGFHSLWIGRHEQKVSAEGDFVIVRDDAVLVLEVKGGRVRREGGMWFYRDRNGVDHASPEGPFRQAEGAMYGLRRRLTELIGGEALSGFAFGFAVVTPNCSLHVANVEWDRETVIDESSLRGLTDLDVPLNRAIRHWRVQRGMGSRLVATPTQVSQLVKACRPDFDPVRSLGSAAASIGAEMLRLTEQQYKVFDMVREWDRIVIEGGAGTGKTLLGVEAARREAEEGRTVLLTCRSPVLAAWLRTRVPDAVRVVPHRVIAAMTEQFDTLICDEAQDILGDDALGALDGLVKGGLDSGRWVFLLDPHHQTDVLGSFDSAAYELVKSQADGRPLRLTENVRNTAAVINEVCLVTGSKLERVLVTGDGGVRAGFPENPAEEARLIRSWLKDFRREEIAPGGVTIITPDGSGRFLEYLPTAERQRIRTAGGAAASEWPLREISLAAVADFKGLENDVVILADLWDLDPSVHRNILYVAMTRSRVELRIAWPSRCRTQVDAIKATNVNLLVEGP